MGEIRMHHAESINTVSGDPETRDIHRRFRFFRIHDSPCIAEIFSFFIRRSASRHQIYHGREKNGEEE